MRPSSLIPLALAASVSITGCAALDAMGTAKPIATEHQQHTELAKNELMFSCNGETYQLVNGITHLNELVFNCGDQSYSLTSR